MATWQIVLGVVIAIVGIGKCFDILHKQLKDITSQLRNIQSDVRILKTSLEMGLYSKQDPARS